MIALAIFSESVQKNNRKIKKIKM